ncbi:hypothetical protein KEM54_000156 [Ascosphaera aggregata]|nr:hypothetical protein KEM54_000156 [Ascosphaera aggregata]
MNIKPSQNDPSSPGNHHPWQAFEKLPTFYGGVKSLIPENESLSSEYTTDNSTKQQSTQHPTEEEEQRKGPNHENIILPSLNSSHFNPYPDYSSPTYINSYGIKKNCYLANNSNNSISIPLLRYYPGLPSSFPRPQVGSNPLLGIKDHICFDRFGRLGPYGYGYPRNSGGTGAGVLGGDTSDIDAVWEDVPPVDFRAVNWGHAQDTCVRDNAHRFKGEHQQKKTIDKEEEEEGSEKSEKGKTTSSKLPRSVILLRTWTGYQYTPESILYLRSLISEVSLHSGGEYSVHFLIHVKDNSIPIWADPQCYQQTIHNSIPAEFADMATLWTEKQMELIYWGIEQTNPKKSVYENYRSSFMPVQYWAYMHPEYEFVWNWEMDVRNTGNWYHFFESVSKWAKAQPRKGIWERSARYYIPSVHGSWEEFRERAQNQTTMTATSADDMLESMKKLAIAGVSSTDPPLLSRPRRKKSIWGPERPEDEEDVMKVTGEGIPPTTEDDDNYVWGVDEDADLIVLNPLFDPRGTTWLLRDDVTGYDQRVTSTEQQPPRRAAIVAASRLSRNLLLTMHRESAIKKHTMFTEMWPASCALHHGFKAVYAPHAMYFDRRWPTEYLDAVLNAGKDGAVGGTIRTVYGEREHNFAGSTWFYSAKFAEEMWRRWLGLKSKEEGNEEDDGGEDWEVNNEGRMCLPPMLLHPVKKIELPLTSEYEV